MYIRCSKGSIFPRNIFRSFSVHSKEFLKQNGGRWTSHLLTKYHAQHRRLYLLICLTATSKTGLWIKATFCLLNVKRKKKRTGVFRPLSRSQIYFVTSSNFFADEFGFRRMLDGCAVRSRRRLWLNKIKGANLSIQAFSSNNYSSLCFRCILNLHRNEGSLLELFVNTWTNETFYSIFWHNWQLVNKTPCVNYATKHSYTGLYTVVHRKAVQFKGFIIYVE